MRKSTHSKKASSTRYAKDLSDDDSIKGGREHAFLQRLCERLRQEDPPAIDTVGPGDDAAVFASSKAPLVATTDAMVEGIHFHRDWLTPTELGGRALASNFSDLAAMGATPSAALLALIVPDSVQEDALDELAMAVAREARAYGATLSGGNISRGDALAITITALGYLQGPPLLRTGASSDELLVVTGSLGDAALAVDLWKSGHEPAPYQRKRFASPKARTDAGRVLAAAGATAAIDISDGLFADLNHLCRASSVGAVVHRDALPRSPAVERKDADGHDFAANGGEAYELLLTIPRTMDRELAKLAGQCGTGLSVIGHTTPPTTGVRLLDSAGQEHSLSSAGFDHLCGGTD